MRKKMDLRNREIKQAMREKNLLCKELAKMCAVTPVTLSRWFSSELPEDKKKELLAIIEKA